MNLKPVIGAILAYAYNCILGLFPSHRLRSFYLKAWFKSYGSGTFVQTRCQFLNGRKVSLGERNVINFGCLLDGRHFHIQTGNDVSIGPKATILTLGHDPQSSEFAVQGGDVSIGDKAWICYRAIVLPSISIGEGAVVAAGAVVTKDVEPYTIVAGNPARKIGERSEALQYQLNYRPFLL